MTLILGIFCPFGYPFMAHLNIIDCPHFFGKTLFCLYPNVVPEMYYLTVSKHFLSIFTLLFDPFDPLFHCS